MTSMAENAPAMALPAHPLWCEQVDLERPAQHCATDPYHRSDPLHAELEHFDVAVQASIVQTDEQLDGEARYIGEPLVEFRIHSRTLLEHVSARASLDEMRALVAMLSKQVDALQRVHEMAATRQGAALMTLGWRPSVVSS